MPMSNSLMPGCCCGGGTPTCALVISTPGPCGAIPSGNPLSATSKTAYITYTITNTTTGLVVSSGANWSGSSGAGYTYGPATRTISLPAGNYQIDASFQPLTAILTFSIGYDYEFYRAAQFVGSWSATFTIVCPGTNAGISIPTTPTAFREFFHFQLEHPAGSPYGGDFTIVTDSADSTANGTNDPALNNNHILSLSGTIAGGLTPSHTLSIKSSQPGHADLFGTVTLTPSYCSINDPDFRPVVTVVVS
jgi:hypothetical protein